MYLPKICELKCERITVGSFSGERVCEFDVYEDGVLVQASPSVPMGNVDEGKSTLRVRAIGMEGDRTRVLFPRAGAGDFDDYYVPSENLVDLVRI